VPDLHHLPGHPEDADAGAHRGRTPGGMEFRAPALTPDAARSVADAVRSAALAAREELELSDVVEALAAAARRLTDPGTGTGRSARELLAREAGWTGEMAEETLRGMGRIWTPDALRSVIRSELEDPGVLDGFGRREPVGPGAGGDPATSSAAGGRSGPGRRLQRRRRAAGPPLIFVVNAGNVPGVAVTAAIRGLLVRSGVLLKCPEEEPGLLPLFARSLARESRLLGDSLAAIWWPGGSGDPARDAWTEAAGTVVVYGGAPAVRGARERLPSHADLVAYGPRVGVAVVLPDAAGTEGDAASALARDVCAYEQRGCVSPRIVYLPGTRDPVPFARRMGEALAAAAGEDGAPQPTGEEATAIRSLRAREEMTGYGNRGDAPRVIAPGDDDLSWTVLVGGDPSPVTEGLPRVVRVHGLEDLGALETLLRPLEGRIQSLGYAGEEGVRALAEMASRLGVARVAPLGTVAWPPADWRHDGRHQLLPLLRWTDWERPG
jgi:hypothetical protein